VALAVALAGAAVAPAEAADPPPVGRSEVVPSARWIGPRFDPPPEQRGDILPLAWAGDGHLYLTVNDGRIGTERGRSLIGRIVGTPPRIGFRLRGRSEPFGHRYSYGLHSVNGVMYATRVIGWLWKTFEPFRGLRGIAYSYDYGKHWRIPERAFPAWTGDLNFVTEGRDAPNRDGYVYAIANEREFNASGIALGRVRPDPEQVSDPEAWQWFSGTVDGVPQWSSSFTGVPAFGWPGHITYPHMTYDPAIHRYLLAFSHSYHDRSRRTWTGGAELAVLESPKPWGPFHLVFRSQNFGPSNGYGGGFPIPWQGRIRGGHQDVWMYWAANWLGCDPGLDCSGKYGFNLRRLRLNLRR
jgi:hypothetical protein